MPFHSSRISQPRSGSGITRDVQQLTSLYVSPRFLSFLLFSTTQLAPEVAPRPERTHWSGTPYRHIQTRMAPQERVGAFPTRPPIRACCPFKTAQKQFIKCHFYVGSKPLQAWVCSVLDPQDSIKELLNCVLCIWVPSRDEKRRLDVDT